MACVAMFAPACAVHKPMNKPATSHGAQCDALIGKLEFHIHKAKTRDAQYAVVEGYPLYRVDRLLEALVQDVQTTEQRLEWLRLAAENSVESYLVEFHNLPPERKTQFPSGDDIAATLRDCAWQQTAQLQQPNKWENFKAKVVVPSEYYVGRRFLGLYPLTNLAMKAGIAQWQSETRELFNHNVADTSHYQRWRLNTAQKTVGEIQTNALGMPVPTKEQWQALANNFAPEWVLETLGDYDIPGQPLAKGQFKDDSVVYWQQGYGRVHGELLPQISYVIWFSERPKTDALDILGGKLDGLVWRVTLKQEASGAWEPLIYDSIHPCGCYHLFFPTPKFEHCAVDDTRESAFVPQAAPESSFAIWVQSATHYLRRLQSADKLEAKPYRLAPLNTLRYAQQEQSRLFDSAGIVRETARLERVLLWTSGLESPGAMRQWGNHATAFSGERYFDEVDLFDQEFCLVNP